MDSNQAAGWSRTQRALHWWTALAVVVAMVIGWSMGRIPDSALLVKFLAYQAHKTLGLAALAMAVPRLWVSGWRRPLRTALPPAHRWAARIVHGLLYDLLLAAPALGYLAADTAPVAVPTFFLFIPLPATLARSPAHFAVLATLHWQAAALLAVLAGGHTTAALLDHWRGRPTLTAMRPALRRRRQRGAPER
jgi:cytochrome b561